MVRMPPLRGPVSLISRRFYPIGGLQGHRFYVS
jgi:hypothetical protein